MTRETENVLLLLVGVSTAAITISGVYPRYVKPSLLPWLAATAALLVVLALIAITRDIRGGSRQDHDTHGDHPHQSSVLWLLVVPIALLAFVVPPAIGPQAPGIRVAELPTEVQRRPFPPLPAERAPELPLPELLIRVAQDSAGTLDDRLVSVVGFTIKDDARVHLGRVVILCCAADAQLARLRLSGPTVAALDELPESIWVRVEGKVHAGQHDSARQARPVLQIQHWERIEQPPNTYSY